MLIALDLGSVYVRSIMFVLYCDRLLVFLSIVILNGLDLF